MISKRIIVVGGGAAGFFAAISCAEASRGAQITILEKSPHFLTKVRISGGGRCNVTHACFDPRELATRYPRGDRALIAPFHTFQVPETIAWFERRGVRLKTESDGRMFPQSDTSETIIDCLLGAAAELGIEALPSQAVLACKVRPDGGFTVLTRDESRGCDSLLLATGGCRSLSLGQLAVSLGHTLVSPVPSLFTFHIEADWLTGLSGVSVERVEVTVPHTRLRETGPLLITHWGLSGPAVLRLSAWGARSLHDLDYRFPLQINWLPHLGSEAVSARLQQLRAAHPAKRVVNTPMAPLPGRLWECLVMAAGIPPDTRWSTVSRRAHHDLTQQLHRTQLQVAGKSLNKDEFVTCGGIPLAEVHFQTMQSRVCPGLYFAGELLDIDGITGGYNFQAAWTTGYLAGRAMASA